MSGFIGREEELRDLNRFINKKKSSLIVIRGRRRIGKSRLVEEFARGGNYISITGIPPTEKTTAQGQRDEFAYQLGKQINMPGVKADDWNVLFSLLANHVSQGRYVILFDEISWMGNKDSDFLGKLKTAWDNLFKKNNQLILILCGSASSWIEKNILSSTGFLGRVSYILTLKELKIGECIKFWGSKASKISSLEKLKILSVTGGVPRYLEEIDSNLSAEENIKNMCFREGGILVDEFNHIFSDLFTRKSAIYEKIVRTLAGGSKGAKEISELVNFELSGRLSEYLEELELAGLITRDYTWNLNTGEDLKFSKYRLHDNYLRFYLKYIDKDKTKIIRDNFKFKSLSLLPKWDIIMGLQFENFVLNNRSLIHQKLGIDENDIISSNPFFQRKNSKQKGCQIDYLIQTKFNCLYICEIKFGKSAIGNNVIREMEGKIDALKIPKQTSIRPVLIHVNELTDKIELEDYFANIINFNSFLI